MPNAAPTRVTALPPTANRQWLLSCRHVSSRSRPYYVTARRTESRSCLAVPANRCVVAQPGVTNLAITQAVEHAGFYYAPDPSSQVACTIGGNVAENSGGV